MVKIKSLLIVCFLFCLAFGVNAQGSFFGVKGGLTAGFQKWNNYERDPLFAFHGIVFIESASEDNRFSVFAQGGYHVKGSAIRNRNFFNPINGQIVRPPTTKFEFRNLSLTLGGKQKFDMGVDHKMYYLFGIRGDYTLNTNFEQYEDINTFLNGLFYPDDAFLRRWNYGVTIGGGFEFFLSEYVATILEFTVNPDFSRQYLQPLIPNVYDPYTGVNRDLNETSIRNTTFEISLGFGFLRKIEYIDVHLF